MAGSHTLVIKQGSKVDQPFVYCNPVTGTDDEPNLDDPVDITDWDARMQVRRRKGDATPILDLTSDVDGGLVIDGVAGMVTVQVSAEDTAALSFSSAVWDLELVPPTPDEPFRLVGGRCVLSREVTRDVPP